MSLDLDDVRDVCRKQMLVMNEMNDTFEHFTNKDIICVGYH